MMHWGLEHSWSEMSDGRYRGTVSNTLVNEEFELRMAQKKENIFAKEGIKWRVAANVTRTMRCSKCTRLPRPIQCMWRRR
jgi:hypothetical protein